LLFDLFRIDVTGRSGGLADVIEQVVGEPERDEEGTTGLPLASGVDHGAYSLHKFAQFGGGELASGPQDNCLMDSDQPVGQSHARPIDAAGYKIGRVDGYTAWVCFLSTRYLADQKVAACERCEHDSGPTLARLKIGERKRDDDHVAPTNSAMPHPL